MNAVGQVRSEPQIDVDVMHDGVAQVDSYRFLLYELRLDCYSPNLWPIPYSSEVVEGGVKMDAAEPRVRRRGFFLHSDTAGEHDAGEHDNPEGVTVRVRISRRATGRQSAGSGGRARTSSRSVDEGRPQIRSGSVTGSRQRAHLPR